MPHLSFPNYRQHSKSIILGDNHNSQLASRPQEYHQYFRRFLREKIKN